MEEINNITYLTSQEILFGIIEEYDIKKANICILYNSGAISRELYETLYYANNLARKRYIGNMIKENKEIFEVISKGILKFKNLFYKANNITLNDIVSIHNDAVFILNKPVKVTKFDNIEFVNKGRYSLFIKVFTLEIYYQLDVVHNLENIEIKGISDIKLKKHEDYFIDFLKTLFATLQTQPINESISLIKSFSEMYLTNQLDTNYYREFNSTSLFKLNYKYYTDICLDNYLSIIDKSYNYNFLRELFSIVSSIYFSKINNL